jgi:hypothetical protein
MAVRWFLAFLPCTTSNVTKRKTRTTSPDRCVSCFWRLSALASRRLADQVLFLADTGLCKFRRSPEAGSISTAHGFHFHRRQGQQQPPRRRCVQQPPASWLVGVSNIRCVALAMRPRRYAYRNQVMFGSSYLYFSQETSFMIFKKLGIRYK